MSFQYPPVNTADQISTGPFFSLGCHQFAISHGPSGAIIDEVFEWDEGNLRFNFICKVEGRFVSRLTPMCSE